MFGETKIISKNVDLVASMLRGEKEKLTDLLIELENQNGFKKEELCLSLKIIEGKIRTLRRFVESKV